MIPGLTLEPIDGDRLVLRFAYHPDTVARVKPITGRRWHAEQKCWSVPLTPKTLIRLKQLFDTQPVRTFPTPEQRPGAITRRRWEALSATQQTFITSVEEEMKLRGYSPKTRKSYRNHLLHFKRHFHTRVLKAIGAEEIRQYRLSLIDEKGASPAYFNQALK